jgi:hypothetical protein
MSRLIPESYWQKAFIKSDGRYDGKKFEELAFQLLENLHGLGWKETSSSHDGSRDFERFDDNGSLWAECKSYADNLSIYVISPTLVMALIEAPHTVIVISRSNLNANAFRHLAAYQMVSGKTIISYDGTTLDHAILMTRLHEKYFPDLTSIEYSEPKLEVRCSLTRDVLTDPSEEDFEQNVPFISPSRPIDIVRYGLLRADFSIKNLSAKSSSEIKIQLLPNTLDPSLKIISFGGEKHAVSTSLQIAPGGIARTSLILQPRESRELIKLPEVMITGDGSPTKPIKTGKAHISQLYRIDVVGRNHKRVLEQSSRFLNNRRRPVIITLEGASGTGKSRLLHEIARNGLEEGYRCHFYDPEFDDAQGTDHVVRSLIADLSEMPLIIHETDEDQADVFPPSAEFGSLLTRILYDPRCPLWDCMDDTVKGIISLLKKRRTLLIIDNVQFTNDLFVEFLEALLIQLNQLDGERVVLVISVNTDFVRPESRLGTLLTKLRAWHADSSRSEFFSHARLTDFDTDDVAEFVQSVFSGHSGNNQTARLYEKTLETIIKYVQPRPLNLWQSLMYLADEGVVSLDGDRLRISENENILNRLSYIPTKLEDLLKLRWLRIRENEARNGIPENELETAVRAAYLLGSDVRRNFETLGATTKAVDILLRAGILTSKSGGRIQFFHNQVFNFFRERHLNFDKTTAIALKRSFESLNLTKHKFQQYFILSHFSENISGAILSATVRHMKRDGLTIDYWKEYTDILLGYLMSPRRTLNVTSITGVTLIGEWQKQLDSLTRGAATLREFLTNRILGKSRKSLPGESLSYFYTITANSHLATYNDSEALEVIELAISDLEKSQFANDESRNSALATMMNRKTATLKNFGRVDEAAAVGFLALQKFKENKDLSMTVETLYDLGSLLLGVFERRSEGWQLLEEGSELFRLNRKSMKEPVTCRYYYVNAEISLRDKRFIDAFNSCAEGSRHAERVMNHFWGVRLILLEVAARLLAGPKQSSELEIINRLLIRARDWVNTSQTERSQWALNYLDGKFLILTGEYARAANSFAETIVNLTTRLRTAEQVAWRSNLFRDIAATCRKYRLSLDEQHLSLIANYAVSAEIREILSMSEKAFTKYEKMRSSLALFNYNGEVIELP